jgi:hypothetical protein
MVKEYRRHRHKYDRKKRARTESQQEQVSHHSYGSFLFGTVPEGEINATPLGMKQHKNEQNSDDRPKEDNLGDGILHSGWKGRWIRSSCVCLVPFACQVFQAARFVHGSKSSVTLHRRRCTESISSHQVTGFSADDSTAIFALTKISNTGRAR